MVYWIDISIEGLCTLLYDANSFLPYYVSVCSLTPIGVKLHKSRDCRQLCKYEHLKYIYFGTNCMRFLKTKTCSFKYIIVFTVLIKIFIIRNDKSVFSKSMLKTENTENPPKNSNSISLSALLLIAKLTIQTYT